MSESLPSVKRKRLDDITTRVTGSSYVQEDSARQRVDGSSYVQNRDAVERWSQIVQAQTTRVDKRNENSGFTPDKVAAQWKLDSEYLESYLRTLKTSCQREVNNNPIQYFDQLYRDLVLWKRARRPAPSPLAHASNVFKSLKQTAHEINGNIWQNHGWSGLREDVFLFHGLVCDMYSCILDLEVALDEEDMFDEDDAAMWRTLEERYEAGDLKFMKGWLKEKYTSAGL
ncbi:hypothetical protein V5O48_015663 [Marasmius crinis-equi]|uniref:Uncharacterized protein n=1 Tax=Marasmius crinis-equi TaxID=585013 RepID=A0ABR3ETY0_9AGAR